MSDRLRDAAERVYGAAFTDQSQPRRCFVATDAIEELGAVLYYGAGILASERRPSRITAVEPTPDQFRIITDVLMERSKQHAK